ncbi:hypothetical protein JCM33774_45960 [Actinophytocola sp. KF-1]
MVEKHPLAAEPADEELVSLGGTEPRVHGAVVHENVKHDPIIPVNPQEGESGASLTVGQNRP